MRCPPRAGVFLLVLAAAGGCAHIEPPPGGEEDTEPPVLASVTPDTLATVAPFEGPVVFTFDERLSEQGVEDAVMVSPRTSEIRVGKSGDELRVELGEGWAPGFIYQVTITPTLQDLWNNRLTQPIHHVFSTGPTIPDTRLTGSVTDLITGEPEVEARVEAVRTADSLVYAVLADSAGGFSFSRIPEGEYLVRAFRELSPNRELDPFEPQDSGTAVVSAGDTASSVSLAIVLPDTTAPVVASAQYSDGRIEVQFDDYLDPEQTFSPDQIRVIGPSGTSIAVERMAVGTLEELDAVAPDTIPSDTAAADTTMTDTLTLDTIAADTAPAAEPRPSQTLTLDVATDLTPETEYRITIQAVRKVVGLAGGGEATFTTPAAQPPPEAPAAEPPDSVPPDTVGARGPSAGETRAVHNT